MYTHTYINEESLRVFIDQVNLFYPTIKFTAEYSKEEVNFLDLNIKLIDGEFKTDLFVKPTNTHQFLDPTSSHPYQCKRGNMYICICVYVCIHIYINIYILRKVFMKLCFIVHVLSNSI